MLGISSPEEPPLLIAKPRRYTDTVRARFPLRNALLSLSLSLCNNVRVLGNGFSSDSRCFHIANSLSSLAIRLSWSDGGFGGRVL